MIAQQRIQYFTTSDYVRVGIEVLNDIMIAQWDSPLSVLPVARVMIAQWDSRCLSSLGSLEEFLHTNVHND